jgi:myo-inositol-1(or 4)-monophosphatase
MLSTVTDVAREAGQFLRAQFGQIQKVNQSEIHDIKLQIDVDTQRLIESKLMKAFPKSCLVGEEECTGDLTSEYRWVVDPLDGTVNYTYAIPHFCVSIGLQKRNPNAPLASALEGYESVLGVVYDPMRDELFTAEKGKGAFLNGKAIRVSSRKEMNESIFSIGFSKSEESLARGLSYYTFFTRKARKIRTMGSAALDLAYVASGRMEMYLEFKVSLWDIAAGILMVTEAGGLIDLKPIEGTPYAFETLATNGIDWRKQLPT